MTMNFLKEFKLDQVLQTLTQPFLGICIGLQILGARSEEKNTACLDILEGEVVKNFFWKMALVLRYLIWDGIMLVILSPNYFKISRTILIFISFIVFICR